jgi:hypothetical protein
MNNIVLFLDIDGVLNQYNIHERIRRYKIHKKDNFSKKTDVFNPFPKKVLKLFKLIKKYNIDIYVFSAWTQEDLETHLPFELKGDTGKLIKNLNEISKTYKYSILIDDELFAIEKIGVKGQNIRLNKNLIKYQPNLKYGLVNKDFIKLEKIFKKLNDK